MPDAAHTLPGRDPSDVLAVLARCDAGRLKAFAEPLIADLGEIEVIENRTGLVMLPMRDTAMGTHFHLGEVLMSEAHISADGVVGYGMRRGRDLEAAMAMAVVDAAIAAGLSPQNCEAFIAREAGDLAQRDDETLRAVEATRVDMETF
ncbi:MAG: phosphonate C-P lyase system protein PhnG [Pseudomonadota bacterium]